MTIYVIFPYIMLEMCKKKKSTDCSNLKLTSWYISSSSSSSSSLEKEEEEQSVLNKRNRWEK